MSALVLFKLRARTKTKGSPVHPRSSFSSVAATSLPPLLLCCCCCAAASAVPRSAMHRGARSAMPIAMHRRTCNMQRVRKKVPLRCSISSIWRSGLPRGAVTKNSNFTVPQRVEELLRRISRGCKLHKKHCTTSSSFPTCKISQGDAELKGFVKCTVLRVG